MATEKKAQLEEGAVLLLNKGRRGLLRLVFGRTAVIIALLLAQVALLLAGFVWLGERYVYGGGRSKSPSTSPGPWISPSTRPGGCISTPCSRMLAGRRAWTG